MRVLFRELRNSERVLFTSILTIFAVILIVIISKSNGATVEEELRDASDLKAKEKSTNIAFLLTFKDAESLLKKLGWRSTTRCPVKSNQKDAQVTIGDLEIKGPQSIQYEWVIPQPSLSEILTKTDSVYYKVKYPEKRHRVKIKTDNEEFVEPECFLNPIEIIKVKDRKDSNNGVIIKKEKGISYLVVPVQNLLQIYSKNHGVRLYYTRQYFLATFEKPDKKEN